MRHTTTPHLRQAPIRGNLSVNRRHTRQIMTPRKILNRHNTRSNIRITISLTPRNTRHVTRNNNLTTPTNHHRHTTRHRQFTIRRHTSPNRQVLHVNIRQRPPNSRTMRRRTRLMSINNSHSHATTRLLKHNVNQDRQTSTLTNNKSRPILTSRLNSPRIRRRQVALINSRSIQKLSITVSSRITIHISRHINRTRRRPRTNNRIKRAFTTRLNSQRPNSVFRHRMKSTINDLTTVSRLHSVQVTRPNRSLLLLTRSITRTKIHYRRRLSHRHLLRTTIRTIHTMSNARTTKTRRIIRLR